MCHRDEEEMRAMENVPYTQAMGNLMYPIYAQDQEGLRV